MELFGWFKSSERSYSSLQDLRNSLAMNRWFKRSPPSVIGQWFRYVMGLIEIALAILLLIPALAGIIALLAVPMMIGVVLIQLLFSGGSSALPIGLLMIACIVARGRKETTHRLIWV